MEKAKEIELLKSLKSDSYLVDEFGTETIDKMCENIKNDFPVMLGTPYMKAMEDKKAALNKKVAKLESDIEALAADYQNQKREFAEQVLVAHHKGNLDAVIEQEFDYAFIIKTKRANGIALSDEEIDWMVNKL